MLLRKRLVGAVLTEIRQIKNDRILELVFDGTTEIGDRTTYYLICEIMGQRSNIILCDNDYRIIDAVKRIDEEKSSVREILPGLKYELPPMQDKMLEQIAMTELFRVQNRELLLLLVVLL